MVFGRGVSRVGVKGRGVSIMQGEISRGRKVSGDGRVVGALCGVRDRGVVDPEFGASIYAMLNKNGYIVFEDGKYVLTEKGRKFLKSV